MKQTENALKFARERKRMEGIGGNGKDMLVHKVLYRAKGVDVIGMLWDTLCIKCEQLVETNERREYLIGLDLVYVIQEKFTGEGPIPLLLRPIPNVLVSNHLDCSITERQSLCEGLQFRLTHESLSLIISYTSCEHNDTTIGEVEEEKGDMVPLQVPDSGILGIKS